MSTRREKSYLFFPIGISFLPVIFVTLCLAVLGTLTLSGALRDHSYSVKAAEKTKQYYTAAAKEQHKRREGKAKALVPTADGTEVYNVDGISLDASHTADGYVMLNYNGSSPKVKLQVRTPDGKLYTYSVTEYGSYTAYPLSAGSGAYECIVYEAASVENDLYAAAMAKRVFVQLANEFMPFLYANCYADFGTGSACVGKGEELAEGCNSDLDVVGAVYAYVTKSISYDHKKAETVRPGYVPNPDHTLASGTGICFDYASLMTSMLRSQGIPTRLEVGYMEDIYHAWISCYVAEIGWVEKIIAFDGKNWTLMDPTTAAANGTRTVMKLQKKNKYTVKYLY